MKTLEVPVLNLLLDPLGRILSPRLARKLVDDHLMRKRKRAIEKLARRRNEGRLTDRERRENETHVQTMDFIAILQPMARSGLKRVAAGGCLQHGASVFGHELAILNANACG